MAGTLDRCPLNRDVRLIGVSVKRGLTVYIYYCFTFMESFEKLQYIVVFENVFEQKWSLYM